MSSELVLYTNPMSRGRIVRWILEEIGHPYQTELVPYGATMKAPEYRAINPMGKVPALKHGNVVITECAAICAYLADAFPAAALAPASGDRLRGPYYRWLFFFAGPLEAASTNKMLGVTVPEDKRGFVGYGSLDEVLAVIDAALSGRDFLVGDRFSAADVYASAHLGWGMQFGTVERRPRFERYCERHSARPAAIRAREIDDALLASQAEAPEPS
ncbi:MAG: glutathione S-transferase family protein [Rhodospirillales bacterium]|nr:glutathione S-transferase family protein [Rhodospirillales bacterium]